MRIAAITVSAAAVATALAFAGVGATGGAHGQTAAKVSGITVTGLGTVKTVPDRAEFSFGVTTTGKTATAALSANAAEMTKVIDALKKAAVAPADIQTQYVSLSPRTTENGETIIGYTAHNSVSAKIKELGRAGAVIDAAVAAGANEISGPNLTRSDSERLYRTALRAAIANARAKAQAIASASNARLGRILGVAEAGSSPVPLIETREALPATSPIEPGTQLIQASVTVTFALR